MLLGQNQGMRKSAKSRVMPGQDSQNYRWPSFILAIRCHGRKLPAFEMKFLDTSFLSKIQVDQIMTG